VSNIYVTRGLISAVDFSGNKKQSILQKLKIIFTILAWLKTFYK
jgi:hypothetical protein